MCMETLCRCMSARRFSCPTGIGSVLTEDVRHPCPVSSRSLPGMAHMPGGEDNVEFVYRSFGVTFNIAVNIYAGFRIFT